MFHLQSSSLNWGTFALGIFSRNLRRKTVAPPPSEKMRRVDESVEYFWHQSSTLQTVDAGSTGSPEVQ